MTDALKAETRAMLRIAHLQMIQGVIARMSAASLGLKGFCASATAAILALKAEELGLKSLWLTSIVLIFALCDANYLRLETEFRRLYKIVASRDLSSADDMLIERPSPTFGTVVRSLTSWSVGLFYGAIMMVILAISLFSVR